MNRRTATDADMKIGAIVYKGNGKVQWTVTYSEVVYDGSTRYMVSKVGATAKSRPNQTLDLAKYFTVED